MFGFDEVEDNPATRSTDPYSRSIEEILTNDSFRKQTAHQSGSSAHVQKVDFLARENANEHHTDRFHLVKSELQTPIFRRGQAFSLQIDFKSSFQLTDKNLRLDFSLGSDPSPGRGTLIHLKVTDSPDFTVVDNWGVRVKSKKGSSLILEVKSSASAPIGVWMLTVVTQPGKSAFQVPQHMYLLFNPWCKEDQVYMKDEDLLNEYILNDTGIIYVGESKKILHKSWSFNQFFAVVIPATMYAIERSEIPYGTRGNPIAVSRTISRMGPHIVMGNWTGDYSGGTSPLKWQTSNSILEKYMADKSEVKFGQCWVYAGLACTLCRAIGLPCRVVSCFQAAHDTEKNLTMDRYFDANDNKMKDQSADQIWNFHVWDDVWMTRPDLPEGYGGWQAIDTTPQEIDEKTNIYECGPSSLLAIKNGEIGKEYNTMFIFSEVNADLLTWKQNFQGTFDKISINQSVCGKYVMTKAPGIIRREDITLQYKFAEGTKEERSAMNKAAKTCGQEDRLRPGKSGTNQIGADQFGPGRLLPIGFETDEFNTNAFGTLSAEESVYLNLHPVKSVLLGGTVKVALQLENRSLKPRTVDVSVSAQSVMYTGTKGEEFDISGEQNSADKKYNETVQLASNQKETVTVSITSSMYVGHLREMGYIKLLVAAKVKDTKQSWFKEDTVMAMTPELKIEMPEQMKKGKPCTVKLSFTNLLPKELTKCSFSIASNCMLQSKVEKFRDVKASEEVSHEIDITPDVKGPCLIMAQFNAKNLSEISGSKPVIVG